MDLPCARHYASCWGYKDKRETVPGHKGLIFYQQRQLQRRAGDERYSEQKLSEISEAENCSFFFVGSAKLTLTSSKIELNSVQILN